MKNLKLKHYEKGYIYVGAQYKRLKNGCFKIGQTARNTKVRESEIKKYEDSAFKMLGSLEVPDATSPLLEAIESLVRVKLANDERYTWTKHDHFNYNIQDRQQDLNEITENALNIAQKAYEWLMNEWLKDEYIG